MAKISYMKPPALIFYLSLFFIFPSHKNLLSQKKTDPQIKMEIMGYPDGNISADSIKLKLNVSHIPDNDIVGYSIIIGQERNEYIKNEFIRNNTIPIKDLNNSIKFIRIQCKYVKKDQGEGKYYWTESFEKKINVKLPVQKIKYENFFWRVVSRFYSKLSITLLFVVGIFVFLILFPFRLKIIFLLKALHYRLKQLI